MNEFDLVKMTDVADVTSAKRIFARDYVDAGVPFYRGKEITELHRGALEVSTDLYITEEKFSEIKNKHGVPEQGDILLTSVGTLGSVYLVKPGDRFYFKDGNVTWFRKLEGVTGAYLRYWLISTEGRAQLQKCMIGSSQSAYTIENLKRMEIRLPSIETQRRIASILGAYDNLIEVNRRRIAVLEEMARGLFEEWFVRFRFPGHEAVPILDTRDGPLPEGWTWGTLADIGQASGKSLNPSAFPDETFAHYSLPAFDGGRSPVADQGSAIKSNKLHFDEPVVLVSKLNPRIPRVWFVPKTTEVRQLASTEFVPIKSNNGLPLAYVFAIVSGEQFRNRLVGMAGGTSTSHQRVKPKDILGTPVALAPRQLVMEAGEHLSPVYRLVVQLEAANRSLAASRDLLLPRLISGQLSVAEAERELEEAA